MATEKQIQANRRNAALSTGPTSEEGKAISRSNAMTHGLTSKKLVPQEQEAAHALRVAEWTPCLNPEDRYQAYHLELAVESSLQIDNCKARELDRRIKLAEVAAGSDGRWDEDRQKEAARLGRSLKRNPEEVALQLRSTPAGRDWLIACWRVLLVAVAEGQTAVWGEKQSNEAFDLMGRPKFMRALVLERTNPFPDSATTRALILQQIAALEIRQQNASVEDAELRGVHVRGLVFETDSALILIRRYATTARRHFEKSINLIQKSKAVSKGRSQGPTTIPATVACNNSDDESSPISMEPDLPVETPIVPTTSSPNCETNPIPALASHSIRASDLIPQVPLVEAVANKVPGNRRQRRKLQKESRHRAQLARKSG